MYFFLKEIINSSFFFEWVIKDINGKTKLFYEDREKNNRVKFPKHRENEHWVHESFQKKVFTNQDQCFYTLHIIPNMILKLIDIQNLDIIWIFY